MDEIFEQHRNLLFSIAYRMTSSVMDAEDMVQETFLRWQSATAVEQPKAYLCTIITRLCLDYHKSARVQRESYIGPWLPDPILTDTRPAIIDNIALTESVSIAFLLLLERLSPLERAVFLLHEVFNYAYDEIAEMVQKTAVNCRQIKRRAQKKLDQQPPKSRPLPPDSPLLQTFIQTCATGDMSGLLNILADDVVFYSDGGGKAFAARRPVVGATAVARFSIGLGKQQTADMSLQFQVINNGMGFLILENGKIVSALSFEIDTNGQICRIYATRNPDKLTHLQ